MTTKRTRQKEAELLEADDDAGDDDISAAPEDTAEDAPAAEDEIAPPADAEDTAEDADTSEDDIAPSGDEDAESTEDESEGNAAPTEEKPAAFANLDLRSAFCFGYSRPASKCWLCIAEQARDVGWRSIDVSELETSLAQDVDRSYMEIAKFKVVNIDDDMEYEVSFDNNKSLWNVEIYDSPEAVMTIEERADFFKSEMFESIARMTWRRVKEAEQAFEEVVRPHLDEGELLLVDDVKLDAILSFLRNEHLLENLLDGKYLSY